MMNPEDVGKVLAVAAMYDRRTVGKTDLLAWGEALDGQHPRSCAEAIRAHYSDPDTCGQYLLPGHVIGRIRAQRRHAAATHGTQQVLGAIESARENTSREAQRAGYEAATAALQAKLRELHPDQGDTGSDPMVEATS